MTDAHHGIFWLLGSAITGAGTWYIQHQQLINGTLTTILLLGSLVGMLVGWKKVGRKRRAYFEP